MRWNTIRTTHGIRSLSALLVACALIFGIESAAAAPGNPRPTPPTRPSTMPPRPSVVPARTPVATPVKVDDPAAALGGCASGIFGLELSYTKSGGLSSTALRTLSIPTSSRGTISATLSPGSTAIYGITTNNGVQTLAYGSGSASGSDTSATINAASLCYLQFTSDMTMPTDSDAALTLLKTTFPGVPQRAPYASTQSSNGGYRFTIATTYPVKGENVAQAITLAITQVPGKDQIILSATSATGSYVK